MRDGRFQCGFRTGGTQHGGGGFEQVGEACPVIQSGHPGAKMPVDRFAQPDETLSVLLRDRFEPTEERPFGGEFRGRRGKGLQLLRLGKAVDTPRVVEAQDHAVGDIERECAPGETMGCPGKGHDEIITGKTVFTSYKMRTETMMIYLVQQFANAVPIAALYGALAFGYALIFGMTRRPDITYGALFAFSGQVFLLFAQFAWDRLLLILPAALALAAVLSLLYTLVTAAGIARYVMRPLQKHSPNAVIVASLALLILLSEAMRLAMDSRELWLSPFLNTRIIFLRQGAFEVGLTVIQIGNAAIMACLVFIGHLLLERTRAGRVWRAVADDPDAARLTGIDSDAVFTLSYLSAALVATVCGVLATSYYGTMDFSSGMMFGLKVVLVAAIGGYAVPLRSALGAACYGAAETFWSSYLPLVWRDVALFSALILLAVLFRREARI